MQRIWLSIVFLFPVGGCGGHYVLRVPDVLVNLGQDATAVRFIGRLGGGAVFDFNVPTVNEVWTPVNFPDATIDELLVTPIDGAGHWWLMDDLCFAGEEECPGDVDGDGDTDQGDLGALLAAWDTYPGDQYWDPNADLDGDGHVYQADLGILLGDWGCGPGRTIDFEDCPGGYIANGYEGLNWDIGGGSMYCYGPGGSGGYGVMGTMMALNPFEQTPTGFYTAGENNFDFLEFDFIAAWFTSVTYRFEGYDNGVLEQSMNVTVDCFSVSTVTPNWTDIDEVRIIFVASDYNQGYPGQGSGTHYAIDNIVVANGPACGPGVPDLEIAPASAEEAAAAAGCTQPVPDR